MAKKKNSKEVEVKIEGEEWKKALDEAFKEKAKNAKVDGFRKGKIPRDIYEKKFGKEGLYVAASDSLLNAAYKKALDSSKLEPVTRPSVDIKSADDDGVTFVFDIITKPELKIKSYKGLKVKREEVKVTKEEIEHELKHILEEYEETKTKESGSLEKGDIAVIDFEGFKDGKPFAGGKGENYSLEIGSNTFIPGFEDQLIGMNSGEERDIEVTFPKEYQAPELKGQKATFKVKLHEIKVKIERKFDKELFEDLAIEGVDSKEKLEKHIEDHIKEHKQADNESKYEDALLDEIANNVEVYITEEIVEEEIDRMEDRFKSELSTQGVTLDMFLKMSQNTEKALRETMEPNAYKGVLYRLTLEEIAKLEKINISDDEANKEAEEMAKKYKMKKDDFVRAFGGLEIVKYDLQIRKVMELLKELNK